MKKISILFVALSAVIWGCDKSSSTTTAGGKQVAGRIVYVNTDTLLAKYDYYKDIQKEFEQKGFALENDLKNRATTFQNKVALFQRQAQQGGLTQEQGQTAQMQLAQEEQNIMAYRDNASRALAADQAKQTEELLNNIQSYLKEFNTGDKYDMVIGYSKGGGVLYAKEDLDITKSVLEGLNKKYADDKKDGKVKKADSTATKKK